MTFQPTEEQLAIVAAARDTDENLLISALAGAAKTSTLVLIARALPKTNMLCLSFNKKIATEMQERLPSNCTSMTLNSLGHRVWADTIGKRLNVNTKKNYEILSALIADLSKEEQAEAFETMSDLLRAIESGKTCGYVPNNTFERARPLMTDEAFFDEWLDEEPSALARYLIRETSLRSIKLAQQGVIDFNDQLLMPTVFPASFPAYPLVLVDEAQDLSALNHAMLGKLARKRLIAVGDENQAIYGFRGAHQDSMSLLEHTFSMRRHLLSISFRCPISVVEAARWRAPHMLYPEWAKPGSVTHLGQWSSDDVPQDAAVICRNNAPLFAQAIRFIKAKRYPELVGNDIGKNLVKIMKKFGPSDLPRDKAEAKLARWLKNRLTKARDKGPVTDQAECISIFLSEGETLGAAITYAEGLFAMAGPIKMMTGHKAKGLEFNNVFFLDPHLCRDKGQDNNLRYVIITRAKETLTYVDSEGWSA